MLKFSNKFIAFLPLLLLWVTVWTGAEIWLDIEDVSKIYGFVSWGVKSYILAAIALAWVTVIIAIANRIFRYLNNVVWWNNNGF